MSIARKQSSEGSFKHRKNGGERPSKQKLDWLRGEFTFYEYNDLLIAIPSLFVADVELISSALNPVLRGVSVATLMRNKPIPEHGLALSTALRPDVFPVEVLTKDEALAYLAKDTLAPKSQDRGFALVSFEGNRLGFVNRLGNRLNNLYPSSWRIRMDVRGASSNS